MCQIWVATGEKVRCRQGSGERLVSGDTNKLGNGGKGCKQSFQTVALSHLNLPCSSHPAILTLEGPDNWHKFYFDFT